MQTDKRKSEHRPLSVTGCSREWWLTEHIQIWLHKSKYWYKAPFTSKLLVLALAAVSGKYLYILQQKNSRVCIVKRCSVVH